MNVSGIISRINPVDINTTTTTNTAKYVENKRDSKWVSMMVSTNFSFSVFPTFSQVPISKKYLPVAVRYAKRYYEKQKYSKMTDNNKNNRYNHLVCK